MDESGWFNRHAKLIRQRQAEEGQRVCFATEPGDECSEIKCRLRHDCFGDFLDSLAANKSFNRACHDISGAA